MYEITDEKVGERIDEITTLTTLSDNFETGRVLYQKIFKMLNGSKMNAFQEIKEWRKIGKQMMAYMETASKGFKNVAKENKRLRDITPERTGKKWTKEEDEILIEMLCDDDTNLIEIATTLGRSVSAISTRCSVLVGIERTKQNISGKFIGKLNGLVVDGTIDGILTKHGGTE